MAIFAAPCPNFPSDHRFCVSKSQISAVFESKLDLFQSSHGKDLLLIEFRSLTFFTQKTSNGHNCLREVKKLSLKFVQKECCNDNCSKVVDSVKNLIEIRP